MQNLDIKFKGNVQKVNIGNTTAFTILPIQIDSNNVAYQEMYEREDGSDVWRFSHEALRDKENFYYVYLKDDGTIIYEDKDGKKEQEEKFDPQKEYTDKAGIAARDINAFKGIVEVKEKTGLNAEDIIKLRKHYLDTKLRILGFLSPDEVQKEFVADKGYYSLRRIAEEMEYYSGFQYVLENKAGDSRYGYQVRIPSSLNQDLLFRKAKMMTAQSSDLEKFMENEEVRKETTNNLLKDYRQDMSKKIPEYDYALYSTEVKKLAKLLLGFNYDLLTEEQRQGIQDLTMLDGMEVQDKISEVIDTQSFSEACYVEDNFVISENCKYVDYISSLGVDDDTVMSTSIGTFLDSQRRETRLLTHERATMTNNYEKMKKMYDAKVIEFRSSSSEKEDAKNSSVKKNEEEGR